MGEAYIVAAARTAGGKRGGAVSGWHPADLAGDVLNGLLDRADADPALVEDVIMGCVIQAGEQSLNIARGAVMSSKLPLSVPGTSVDRQCGSSQQALHFAAATVMAGSMDVVIAAGVECMTRVPMGLSSVALKEHGTAKGPRQEERWPGIVFSQFTGAEMLAEKHQLTKDQLDEYAFRSHRKAAAATTEGRFSAEILPIDVTLPDRTRKKHNVDEGIRFDASIEAIKSVKLLKEGGRVTAATSSQICDGAAALLIANERGLKALGAQPLARVHHMT
ncbi:MAG: acetyl-CoA C-acyltransferase, partial [Stellaceae bacterium]